MYWIDKNVVFYHSSVVKVLAILSGLPVVLPDNRPHTDENTDASFRIGASDCKTYCFVSLMEDGLLSCE